MTKHNTDFIGKILIAHNTEPHSVFYRSCILLCAYDTTGAMGLMLNKLEHNIRLNDLLLQMDIPMPETSNNPHIHMGGPVDNNHGFILHESTYKEQSTACINDSFSLTATVGILSKIIQGDGPKNYKIALGYAGWDGGQLESEIKDNKWLCVNANTQLVFKTSVDTMWYVALTENGIHPSTLTTQGGHG